jgi:NAD(P)H dehydrogenase (quinone)
MAKEGLSMFAVVGATGNVGYSTASTLRQAGVPVKAIVHDLTKAARLKDIGCEIVVAELQDSDALAQAITGADAVQVVLPLRPQASDPAADLCNSGDSLIEALDQASPKRMLVISDYGAHVAEDIGMPSIFHEFEAEFRELGGNRIILRSAEYMHNWGRGIPAALESGTLPSFQDPVEMLQPTINAPDLGQISARLLLRPDTAEVLEIIHAEGPQRYSAADIAAVLTQLSGRTVQARAVPRAHWEEAFARMPASLAELLIKANDAKNKGGLVDVEPNVGEVVHGTTELVDGLRSLMPPQ